ncbi:Phenoxybenzoate dioxygenase subunit beta [wastewater metagenome]|uniref:Phenoxybenzoate dioxygenase subunit beta n=2 Tax=unclassified sequences TaxID=12908 RepID=A0A5B8RGS8_9ZZZZ|nr:PDR/VanB family oxidoreductase [Arhodomonas sp. KWT]QEA07088.1 phenoxybenzoate dioxygenase subunit beta [uncultured organism]
MSDEHATAGGDGFDVVVTRREAAAEGVINLELQAPDGGELPLFTAGAHVDVHLPNGTVRQYSLCNPPHERTRYELGILLEPDGRGGSRCAHEHLTVGARLRLGGPRNQFPLAEAPHTVLVAGGIGVTPLMSMAAELHARGASFELHYCARTPARAAFLERLRCAPFGARVHSHFDDGLPAQRFDPARLFAGVGDGARLYVCGPAGFMGFVTGAAAEAGWPEARVHLEHFAGAAAPAAEDGGFDVALARSGRVIHVGPEETVVEALTAGGVEVPLSCEQGICGTCAMRVLDGEPDHRDMHFSDEERASGGWFTPCCSRAHSPRLVLDF